jgi:hypothetical protein
VVLFGVPQNRFVPKKGTPKSLHPFRNHTFFAFLDLGTPESTLSFSGYPRIGASKLEVPQNRLCHFQGTPESLHPNPNYPRIVVCPNIIIIKPSLGHPDLPLSLAAQPRSFGRTALRVVRPTVSAPVQAPRTPRKLPPDCGETPAYHGSPQFCLNSSMNRTSRSLKTLGRLYPLIQCVISPTLAIMKELR